MNYVEKLVDGVHYVFNLNAATLSGAIDILVIPQPDGTLKCTPFHVRFGKLQLISSSEKVVQIYVNQKKTDLQMKLGHAGEAFFVEETEEPVPSILATSPITSPKPGRVAKTSTEELVSEFMGSRIISTKPSPTSLSSSSTTSITTTQQTISNNSNNTTKVIESAHSISINSTTNNGKPLTEALEEMIIQKNNNNNNNNIVGQPQPIKMITNGSGKIIHPKPSSSATTTTTTINNSPTKKKESIVKRTSSPVYFEGSEEIMIDSPINSYIINCESPIDSPVGSPPDTSSIKDHSTINTPPTSTTTNTSPPKASGETSTSDSESEGQKVGFWRWGGLPKIIGRGNKQPTPTATTATNATTALATTPPLPPSIISTNQLKLSGNQLLPQPPPPPITTTTTTIASASLMTTTIITTANESSTIEVDQSLNSTQATNIPLSSSSGSVDRNMNDDMMNNHNNNNNNNNNNDHSSEEGEPNAIDSSSSSWSKMGSFMKMFTKKEVEPSFLVKTMNSPPPAVSTELKQSMVIESSSSNIIESTSRQLSTSSDGEREIFLLEEEEEQVEKQKKQPRVVELSDDNDQIDRFSTTNGPSFADVVKQNGINFNLDEKSNDLLPNPNNLNENEFPSLSSTTTIIPLIPISNTLNGKSSSSSSTLNSNLSSSPRSSNVSKINHLHHIEQLSKQQQTNSRPSSPKPPTTEIVNNNNNNVISSNTQPPQPLINSSTSSPLPSLLNVYQHPTIKLSLCGHLILDRNLQSDWPEEREKFFNEHIVTYEQLCVDAALFKNPHLVAKIGNEYFPWSVAGHVIVSNMVFNKPLTRDTLDLLSKKDRDERHAAKTPATGKSWKSWLWKSSDDRSKNQITQQNNTNNNNPSSSPTLKSQSDSSTQTQTPPPPTQSSSGYAKKSLRPTSEQLKSLGLKKGANRITFAVSSNLQGTREVSASIYFWDNTSKIVISDIDGTITKSDALGQVLPLIGRDWSHLGVAELYSNIKDNGYQIIYLTSRAIGQAGLTRTYISSVKQSSAANAGAPLTISNTSSSVSSTTPIGGVTGATGGGVIPPTSLPGGVMTSSNPSSSSPSTSLSNSTSLNNNNNSLNPTSQVAGSGGVIGISTSTSSSMFTLPEGPVFMSPNRLLTSFNREVIKKNPEEFKIACLQDIQNIFPGSISPFYAGFGNRSTDAIAYTAVGIPPGKTFTINHNGVINTSNTTYNKTYNKLNDLVQDMFPHANGRHSVNEQWNEFHYWKKSRVVPANKLDPI